MSKQLSALLKASFFTLFISIQLLKAQTNTAYGSGAFISNTTGTFNSAFGYRALYSNTTGSYNSAHGAEALLSNTIGYYNTAHGASSLKFNTLGHENIAVGHQTLTLNTIGSQNVAVGTYALYENLTGSYNTAIGTSALQGNQTGVANTAIGTSALAFNTIGSDNTATGDNALQFNKTGNSNTAHGRYSLLNNTTGNSNTAHGFSALYLNTSGHSNTASGIYASYSNTTGFFNTSSGIYSLYYNGSGFGNTAMGSVALVNNTTGNNNTALGVSAGSSYNVFNSTFIGTYTDAAASVINSTALGYGATVTDDNQIRIGNSAVTSIGGPVNWTVISDGRYKKNIRQDVPGLAFINELRPVTYTLDVEAIDKKLLAGKPSPADKTVKAMAVSQPSAEEQKASNEKAKVKYTGFVAQEVDEAAKKSDYQFSGVDVPGNKGGFYGLRYAEFVVPLVKAVQELSAENKRLQEDLQQQITDLKQTLAKLVSAQTGTIKSSSTAMNLKLAFLDQNVPNPGNGSTAIYYHLPPGAGNARIVITSMQGQLLKSIDLSGNSEGKIALQAGAIGVGSYVYSLWVDGKLADTKQMLILK